MTRYLISFADGALTFPEEDLPDVATAAHEVVREAQDAGAWVFGGGLERQQASVVATDGDEGGPRQVRGGRRASREDAPAWAAKFAAACRCAQEVRELMPDPNV